MPGLHQALMPRPRSSRPADRRDRLPDESDSKAWRPWGETVTSWTVKGWNEGRKDHAGDQPRGHPDNAGQFASFNSGSTTAEKPKKPKAPKKTEEE